jgi:hypothetical protein
MKIIKFIKKSQFGAKGEERLVSDRAALQYELKGLVEKEVPETIEVKEEKEVPETKEEKAPIETKEEKAPKAKVTKAPKF